MTTISSTITVSTTVEEIKRKAEVSGTQPTHWVDKQGGEFKNPWPSFRKHGFGDFIGGLKDAVFNVPKIPEQMDALLPTHKPTWGFVSASSEESKEKERIKATWLGHACFLVELPTRSGVSSQNGEVALTPRRGARILFDPVFSSRCSPSQLVGPKRYTPPPCDIKDMPEIDAIVISHNHYDHLDTHTILTLMQRERKPHIFAPLGNANYFRSLGIPKDNVHIMDWWDSRRIEVEIPAKGTITVSDKENDGVEKIEFDLTCTPCQHFTGRGIFDRFKSLWASWVVEEIVPSSSQTQGVKVFFGGDTGYRAVRDGQNEEEVPSCPVFKEIGGRFGSFDFAMIPIGAYLPRSFMSPIHCAPQDSVRLFKDIRAKKALGMHWGTWILTTEEVMEPPKRLKEECVKIGIPDGDFVVCDIGETMFF